MLRYFNILFISLFCATAASALDVNDVMPGTLATRLADASDVRNLTVTGSIDVRDLDYLTTLATLERLDLSGARIAAYQGMRPMTLQTTFAADVLPPLSLAGLSARALQLPETLKEIGAGALAGAAVTALELPASVTTLDEGAFAGMTALQEVTIPETVTHPGSRMFANAPALKIVRYNASVIPEEAFAHCTALEQITVSGNVTSVGARAFLGCSALHYVNGEWGMLHSLGEEAFAGTAFTYLDLSEAPLTALPDRAFAHSARLQEVRLPAGLQSAGTATAFGTPSLTIYRMYMLDEIPALTYYNAASLNPAQLVGNNTRTIGRYAFAGASGIEEMTLPATLTDIEDGAFANTASLRRIDATALTAAPVLGEGVWKGIDPSTVTLHVTEETAPMWEATPVWNDFNIYFVPGETATDILTPDAQFVATLVGDVLHLRAGHPLGQVNIYDTMGRTVASTTTMATEAYINLPNPSQRIFIVQTNHGSEVHTAKLAR